MFAAWLTWTCPKGAISDLVDADLDTLATALYVEVDDLSSPHWGGRVIIGPVAIRG